MFSMFHVFHTYIAMRLAILLALLSTISKCKGSEQKKVHQSGINNSKRGALVPDAIAPTIKYGERILSNNDIIHLDEVLLSCSFKILDESAKVHLKFTTVCNSFTSVVECYTIYGCNTSIAECYYLDKVHLTCAEYYSKKTTRMLLRRRSKQRNIIMRRVDGEWGQWLPWTSWNPTCGGKSTRKTTRYCDSPYPKNGGKICRGSGVETETRTKNCSGDFYHDGWLSWSPWSSCSLSCDIGRTAKTRKCYNYQPDGSPDVKCVGQSKLTKNCLIITCAYYRVKIMIGVFLGLILGVPMILLALLLVKNVNKLCQERRTNHSPQSTQMESMYSNESLTTKYITQEGDYKL